VKPVNGERTFLVDEAAAAQIDPPSDLFVEEPRDRP
jgi:hypothetical protein